MIFDLILGVAVIALFIFPAVKDFLRQQEGRERADNIAAAQRNEAD